MKTLKSILAVAITFLVVDLVWIRLVVIDIYEAQLGSMMRANPSVTAAVLFYALYVAGIVFIAVRPALAAARLSIAVVNGAALGGIAYGTYTLTNYVLFSDWSVVLVVSDISWGVFLTAVSAAAGYLAAKD